MSQRLQAYRHCCQVYHTDIKDDGIAPDKSGADFILSGTPKTGFNMLADDFMRVAQLPI